MIRGKHRERSVTEGADDVLLQLGRDFARHRTRSRRAWRTYQAITDKLDPETAAGAHRLWSEAIDAALRSAEAISREEPQNLNELLIQYEAIWWWVGKDDNVLDGSTRRWLGRFRRALRRLTAAGVQ